MWASVTGGAPREARPRPQQRPPQKAGRQPRGPAMCPARAPLLQELAFPPQRRGPAGPPRRQLRSPCLALSLCLGRPSSSVQTGKLLPVLQNPAQLSQPLASLLGSAKAETATSRHAQQGLARRREVLLYFCVTSGPRDGRDRPLSGLVRRFCENRSEQRSQGARVL